MHVAIASANGDVRLRHVDPDLATFAALRCCLRIVAEAVLMAKLFSDLGKSFAQLRAIISLVELPAGLVCQLVKISTR